MSNAHSNILSLSVYHLYRVIPASCKRGDQSKHPRPHPASLQVPFCFSRCHPINVTNAMSQAPAATTSTSNYQAIFDGALEAYRKKTKKDPLFHPLFSKLQTCNSPDAVLTLLRDQIVVTNPSRSPSSDDDGLIKWLNPTVHVLYTFSEAIGAGISLVSKSALRSASSKSYIRCYTGISTCGSDLYRDRHSSFSENILNSAASTILTTCSLRLPWLFLPARMRSPMYLSASRISFDALRHMSKFHRRRG